MTDDERMSTPQRPAWTRIAFTALHDLVLDFADDSTPQSVADEALRALSAALPGVPVAVWWCMPDEAIALAGNPPAQLRRLPLVSPPHLCLLRHGDAYDPTLFGMDASAGWRFVPITDRSNLFGWIGLQAEQVPEESGLLAFLCTAGALLGKAWQWSREH